MDNLINYTSCPVCGAAGISKVISARDNTVSHEEFDIFHCSNCQLRFTQNVPDASSISKYYKSENYISHTNTSKGLVNRLYKLVRNISNRQKRTLIEKTTGLKHGNLLDIGSGTGYFAAEIQKANWEITALEPDAEARVIAQELNNVALVSTENLYQLPANNFDVITLWHVLEHVHELKKYIKQIKLLLKEKGFLFVAVPNYRSLDAEIYKEHWAAYDVPRHLYHFSPNAMKSLMDAEGLKIIEMKPMWFDSFYVSLLSSKYKNGSTNWIGATVAALRSNMKAMRDISKCSSVIYIISK
jgi:2-polyprenyl-3-methyl-5-hydroxy-6-metoxy-1,4-benzoquinol methylase